MLVKNNKTALTLTSLWREGIAREQPQDLKERFVVPADPAKFRDAGSAACQNQRVTVLLLVTTLRIQVPKEWL